MLKVDPNKSFAEAQKQIVRPMPDIADYSITELLKLRDLIHLRLPASHLKDINLEEELIFQFIQAKEAMRLVAEDDAIAPNQKAQMVNAVSSIITQISKLQMELFSSERVKHMESTIIKVMQGQPDEVKEAFLVEYEKRLIGSGIKGAIDANNGK